MDFKGFFQKYGIHFIAITLFVIAAVSYFSPQFNGYGLKQHDIEQFKGMSNEIVHFREDNDGKEPLWTNSMFGGMPATQISVIHEGNYIKSVVTAIKRVFPSPSGTFLLHLLCFYIMALLLRIKPVIAIIGAFAFAFSSYELIILQAGHNSKAMAVAILPLVLGAFIYAFRTNWKLGAALSGIFMCIELAMNHYQVTYYLGFLLLGLGIFFFIEAIQKKKIKTFGFATAGILVGYCLALLVNFGGIAMTNDYAKHTIRGANDLTISPNGEELKAAQTGLDKDYITNWSYGIDESFTLISPYIKGSHNSQAIGETKFAESIANMDFNQEEMNAVMNNRLYFGDQPITSGPVYLGVIVVFLALLGMFFIKDRIKWVFLIVSVLALMLSWGKNYMGLTDFFIDNVPGYDKFRTVTIILVLLEMIVPVLGIMVLQKFYENREELKEQKKKFLYISGAFLVFLIGLKTIGIDNTYGSQREKESYNEESIARNVTEQLINSDPAQFKQQYQIDLNDPTQFKRVVDAQVDRQMASFEKIQEARKQIVSESTTRSIVFGILGIGIFALFFYTTLPTIAIYLGLGLLILIDLVNVDSNYLSSREDNAGNYIYWSSEAKRLYPMDPIEADLAILNEELIENPGLKTAINKGEQKGKDKALELDFTGIDKRRVIDDYKFAALNNNTNYRVFELDGGFGSSRASYFHKSLGGYHGAKLRSIQNLMEFQLSRSNNAVLNMMNVKYFIQSGKMRKNSAANGPAWLVKSIKTYDSPNDEIRALGSKFQVKNAGNGTFLINGEKVTEKAVYGGEKMEYIVARKDNAGNDIMDTVDVNLPNGVEIGLKILSVMDVNGKTNLIPESVNQIDTNQSFQSLVSIEMMDKFDEKNEAILLTSEAEKLSSKKFSGKGSVKMTSYAPNKMVYTANVEGKQLAVFSEIYYPNGWTVTVNGKEKEFLKVDYLLRGLELEAGKNKIVFEYDNPKYHEAYLFSLIGSLSLILMLFILWGLPFLKKRKVSK